MIVLGKVKFSFAGIGGGWYNSQSNFEEVVMNQYEETPHQKKIKAAWNDLKDNHRKWGIASWGIYACFFCFILMIISNIFSFFANEPPDEVPTAKNPVIIEESFDKPEKSLVIEGLFDEPNA